MASASDIAVVRRNVNEPTTAIYADEDIEQMVDDYGITGASSRIWREKAAKYASLVNVNEAGASHSYSDLHKNALAMAKSFEETEVVEETPVLTNRVKVKRIQRS